MSALHGTLASVPSGERLHLFGCEGRKDELWKSCLPSQSLSLVQGEVDQLFMSCEGLAEFGKERVFRSRERGDEFPAGCEADLCCISRGIALDGLISRFHSILRL